MSLTNIGTNTIQQGRLECLAVNRTGAALVVGGVYALDLHRAATESTTMNDSAGAAVAVATANINGILMVATDTTADDAVGRFVLRGICQCLVDGVTNDVTYGNRLIAENAATALTSQADSVTGYARAIALGANTTTAALMDVLFDGFTFTGQATAT